MDSPFEAVPTQLGMDEKRKILAGNASALYRIPIAAGDLTRAG